MPHHFLKATALSLGLLASATTSCLLAASPVAPSIQPASERITNAIPVPSRINGAPVVATIFGEPITANTTQTNDIGLTLKGTDIITATLFERYAKERGVTVSDEEIAHVIVQAQRRSQQITAKNEAELSRLRKSLEDASLSTSERNEVLRQIEIFEKSNALRKKHPIDYQSESYKEISREFIQRYKTQQQLYRDYGGRVIFQQMGPEPVDAMRDFLKAEQAKGSFVFHDPEAETNFWKYFTTTPHIYTTDEKEVHRMMNTQWWLEPLPEQGAE